MFLSASRLKNNIPHFRSIVNPGAAWYYWAMRTLPFFAFLIFSLIIGFSTPVWAAQFSNADSPTISAPTNDDLFAASDSILVNAPIGGEAYLAGNTVSIREKVSRSLFVAGKAISVDQGAGYNLWISGQTVVIKGEIGHDVWVAAQTVTIDPSTNIHGQLRVMAQSAIIGGNVDGLAEISVDSFSSSANFAKNVMLEAEKITFTGGTIVGNLTYNTGKEITDFGPVTITGAKNFTKVEFLSRSETKARLALFGGLAILVAGAGLLFFFHRKATGILEIATKQWGKSLGVGTVVLLLVPFGCLLLIMTGIGIPLALILMAGYTVLLLVACLVGYILFGAGVLKSLKQKYISLWVPFIVALVVMSIIQAIPVLGPIVTIAYFLGVFLPTLGATAIWYHKKVAE